MSNPNNYLPLLTVVKSAMNARNEKSLANVQRYLQFGMEVWSDMNIFETDSVEVAYLSVDPDTKVAILPNDFITMTKIGVVIGNRLWTLTQNTDLVLPRPETICPTSITEVNETTEIEGGYYFAPHYRNGRYITTLYGLGGGFNMAYYRIDKNRGVIYFDGHIQNNEVVLEYKSNGIKPGAMLIPRQAVPALRNGIIWRAIENDHRFSMGEKARAEQQYDKELYKLKELECSFSMAEYLDNAYSSYSQTIKR